MKGPRQPRYILTELGSVDGVIPHQLWKVEQKQVAMLLPWHVVRTRESWDLEAGSRGVDRPLHTPPGRYNRRIARPLFPETAQVMTCPLEIEDEHFLARSISQLNLYCNQLDSICQTIYPDAQKTFGVFGQNISDLLVLTCTEIEMHWKGILRVNGTTGNSTADYIKTSRALGLPEYSVSFTKYPWLSSMRPFAKWKQGARATKDIPWYGAYHAVKHNREQEFEQGKLEHVFSAIGALAILMVAQFGWGQLGYTPVNRSALANYFFFDAVATWDTPSYYVGYFEPNQTWAPIDYKW